jgi:hypothetical protein
LQCLDQSCTAKRAVKSVADSDNVSVAVENNELRHGCGLPAILQ